MIKLSHAALALKAALEEGRGFRADMRALDEVAEDDDLVGAVLPSLADLKAGGSVATAGELVRELDEVGGDVR